MEFCEGDEFKKEFKKLEKKYRTLSGDLEVLKKAISATPQGDDSKHWNLLKQDKDAGVYVFKVRMMCRAIRGAQFRVIYAFRESKVDVLFIEVYFKGKKQNEDRERILEYLEHLQSSKLE